MLEELLDTCAPGWSDALAPGASGPVAFMADSKTFVFGAYVDNVPVGWLWGAQFPRPDGRTMSYVHQLDVIEAHRRKGIASSLIEAAIGQARSAGVDRLWLTTRRTNLPARTLYEGLGGQPASEEGDVVFRWTLQ